jgi:hypothetical protein
LRATVFLLAAGFFFATTFFRTAFLSFLTTVLFPAADFFAGLDFRAECDLPRFVFADFLLLAMDVSFRILKRHHAKAR